ncbi:LegC family aminotransferase [Solitalea canadensis]|uniref:GDP-perosamine synthase n=1 Tax=Solitalea canadensis (strain ATCC 29591 / DSM 3403 / JCM 21819 / LMG 8368 / NBRC 15130 / NCIMB 12057 / USAM 9D) TaxID=929556 RepID=H8KMB3_SOLCM|nr:LegC family aminotransferase [Solitalea canadensis]AFD09295.1 putative PLP-dependent enzyme possibly involved in cell wall biogenesis [Solitalea canadensis DSM 3403]
MYSEVVGFIRKQFDSDEFIPLHAPVFTGNEKKYVLDTIDSTFVSSVGKFVDKFEELIREYTGAKYAIATTNGTSALHMALMLAGVKQGDLVLTQPLSFIATCNAISYIGAEPSFIDVDKDTLGLSPEALREFLKESVEIKGGQAIHKNTGRRIAACVPMHTFGHPAKINELLDLCKEYNINLVEDAAESLGSTYMNQQTGTFGLLGTYSFNGNKTITCGGGGMIVTNDDHLGKLAKHLTTQAKVPHRWDFVHDYVGYNYRLPNLNAALACAQMEQLDSFISNKRELAKNYSQFFVEQGIHFISEPSNSKSNYWLNAILLKNRAERDLFLTYSNDKGVMTRPVWELMNRLPMFRHAITSDISNAEWIADRLVNIPSSVRLK